MRRFRLPIAGLAALIATPVVLAVPAPFAPVPTVNLTQDAAAPVTEQDAMRLQDAGQLEEAIEAWKTLVEADSDSGVAMFNLGYCLHGAGRLEEAIEVHAKAAMFEGYSGIAMYNLGCANALLGNADAALEALAAAQANGFEVGELIFSDDDLVSLREDPRIAMFFDPEGGGMRPSGKQRLAMMAQQLAEEFGPKAHQAFAEMAPQAMEHFSKQFPEMMPMIEQVAPMIMDKMGGGNLQTDEERASEAARVEDNAEELQQELSGVVSMLVAYGQQILQMIEMQVQEALANHPGFREALTGVASDPKFDEILQGVRQFSSQLSGGGGGGGHAQANGGGNDRLAAALGQAQEAAQSGDVDTAIEIYNRILKRVPGNADANFLLGYTLHMAGRIEEAIPAHLAAAQHEQYAGIANYNLACAYALTGDATEALKALNRSHDAGFDVVDAAPTDSDFASLKDDKRFNDLMNVLKHGSDI